MRERNKRKWCSEACRVRTFAARNPDYRERCAQLNAERHRATYVPPAHDKTCRICGEAFVAARSDTTYCSSACKFRADYVGRRGRRSQAERERYTLREVGDRDGWACGICGEAVIPDLAYPHVDAPSIDHRIPLARGGDDTRLNVQIAHLHCNRSKGARITEGPPTRGAPIPTREAPDGRTRTGAQGPVSAGRALD